MKKVLILTARFVDGHHAAAHNLCEALETLSPEARVDVVDLFQSASGSLRTVAQKAYTGLMRFARISRGGLNGLVDKQSLSGTNCFRIGRLQRSLGDLLQEAQPDIVVSTYPAYATLIRDLYRDHAERPFRLVSLITDAAPLHCGWLEGPSDRYCVCNEAVAAELRNQSIAPERIEVCGFPVSPLSSRLSELAPVLPESDGPYRILYLVEGAKRKTCKTIKKLLECGANHVTVVVGRNAYLKAVLTGKLKKYGRRAHVLGWTNRLPYLLRTHHVVIGTQGGAMAEEALAACCPMISTETKSGSGKEGDIANDFDVGAACAKPRQVAERVKQAFKRDAKLWKKWRANLLKKSRPRAATEIAQRLLDECDALSGVGALKIHAHAEPTLSAVTQSIPAVRQLLCDFHIHTNYSDGKLTVPEVIDFYGSRHFDCICITDHLADSRRLIGKLGKLSRLTLSTEQLEEYFELIEHERQRAWRKYRMLVMSGLEFNKDGLTKKSSAHLLGIDLTSPISDCLDLPETIAQIHAQGGLAVASHPHIMKSEWGKDTLFLWENQEQFVPLIDAWEIANRNNMFNPVSAKRLPYLANSDFHKPKHIYSWKTLVSCDKDRESIKECIRRNKRIAITLYREPDVSNTQSSTGSRTTTSPLLIKSETGGVSFLPAA